MPMVRPRNSEAGQHSSAWRATRFALKMSNSGRWRDQASRRHVIAMLIACSPLTVVNVTSAGKERMLEHVIRARC